LTIKNDITIAALFALLTFVFIAVLMMNVNFNSWVFDRHQNQLSWYIRPVFLIPFCFFAYKRSWAGISFVIFCLFTSMLWFDKPESVSDGVKTFLKFEKDWLYSAWDFWKILLILTVPFSFFVLGLAFWRNSFWMGLGVIILMAAGKIVWSVHNAGESGKTIIIPAISGLLICSGLIFYGFKKVKKRNHHR